MKTKIALTVTTILLTSHGFCLAPNNNLPKGLKSYQIADLTKSKRFKQAIPVKRAMKFESIKRLVKERN